MRSWKLPYNNNISLRRLRVLALAIASIFFLCVILPPRAHNLRWPCHQSLTHFVKFVHDSTIEWSIAIVPKNQRLTLLLSRIIKLNLILHYIFGTDLTRRFIFFISNRFWYPNQDPFLSSQLAMNIVFSLPIVISSTIALSPALAADTESFRSGPLRRTIQSDIADNTDHPSLHRRLHESSTSCRSESKSSKMVSYSQLGCVAVIYSISWIV